MLNPVVSVIDPIKVNILLKNTPVGQKGFSMPMILGVKQPTYSLSVLSGTSGLKFSAKTAGAVYIDVEYIVSGTSTPLSVSRSGTGVSNDPYVITVNVATDAADLPVSTAAQIKAAAELVANVAGASGIVNIDLLSTPGDGVVSAFTQTSLDYKRYMEITSADDLLSLGFLATDKEYLIAQAMFAQTPHPSIVAVYLLTSWAAIATEIAALRNQGFDGWYKTVATTHVKSEMHSVSDYLSSIEKLFFGITSDVTVLTDRNSSRELYMLHSNPDNFSEARWVGATAPRQVGSFNYAYILLDGVENSGFDNATTNSILADNGNVIARYASQEVTVYGKTTAGVYVDIIVNRDWLSARLQEELASLMINSEVVPYTITGLNMIESKMREVFSYAGRIGIIAPVETADDKKRSDLGDWQYQIVMPASIDEIPTNDRNNRHVGNITFSARLKGAINTYDITGELT